MGNVVASAAAGASSFSIPPSSDRINFEDMQSVIANRGAGGAGTDRGVVSAAHTVTYLIISTLKSEFLNCGSSKSLGQVLLR